MRLLRSKSTIWQRFGFRLTAALLVVSIPGIAILSIILTRQMSRELEIAARSFDSTQAKWAATSVQVWLDDRAGELNGTAAAISLDLGSENLDARLTAVAKGYKHFDSMSVTDLQGGVLESVGTTEVIEVGNEPWFRQAATGQFAISEVRAVNEELEWLLATPILTANGQVAAVLIADLEVSSLARLINGITFSEFNELQIVDGNSFLVYSSKMGLVSNDAALVSNGAFSTKVSNSAVSKALARNEGSDTYEDSDGVTVLGGFAPVRGPGWAVISQQNLSHALAPVEDVRASALVVIVAISAVAFGFAYIFGRRATLPVLRLAHAAQRVSDGDHSARVTPEGAGEVKALGIAFNSMVENLDRLIENLSRASSQVNLAASDLSSASEGLVTVTSVQGSAITETSATSEELARASAAIARTIEEVASQAGETRDHLEEAEADILASSDRTVRLAARMGDIGNILGFMNEIANQANLLALNAAIEAARAGESGRGFSVVADEVRRLAERSKSSAAEIGEIIEGIGEETAASVLAMEKGAKRMQQGRALLVEVAEATAQVSLTCAQQQIGNNQVVDTIEQLAATATSVSATAAQIASAAANLATLASNLESATAEASEPT